MVPNESMESSVGLLVLAGGFGTRLRSVVPVLPKPLAPVIDRPYLYYLVNNWIQQGVTRFSFLLHHQAGLIKTFLKSSIIENQLNHCHFRTLVEPEPLGTGGAVANAVQQYNLSGKILVTNADTWLGTGIKQVSAGLPPAVAVVRIEDQGRYGGVRINEDKIISFEEKPGNSGAAWINAGLYQLDCELFGNWKGQPFSLESEMFPQLAKEGRLKAVKLDTDFIDIGIPEDYLRFCRWIESGKKKVL
ncbi:MAG: sugar phosphate nucleotidyltransferase [Thermodesulfobacteriota bacterium]